MNHISGKVRKHNWIYSGVANSKFDKSVRDIEKVIYSHSDLIFQHTELLIKSLRFNKQKKKENLLKPDEVSRAKIWLEQLKSMNVLPCYLVDQQIDFIWHSEFQNALLKNKEMKCNREILDVYLCFSAKERGKEEDEFIKRLYSNLVQNEFCVETNEFDRTGGANTELRVTNGIVKAKHFIYLIAKSTVEDKFCKFELGVAEKYSKSIIPILYDDSNLNLLPHLLRGINWIYLRDNDDFEMGLAGVLSVLTREQEYRKEHTFISYRAFLWSINGEDSKFLLVGDDLERSKVWFQVDDLDNFVRSPLSEVQTRFIEKSVDSSRRNNWIKRFFNWQ